jgi:hypothetical protein
VNHSTQLNYLESVIKQFAYYKMLGEKAMAQVADAQLFLQDDEQQNSIAVIVKHMAGNMLSRWTDFLTTDGEKEWRNRDDEFNNTLETRAELMAVWSAGWEVFLKTLQSLKESDLDQIVYIRNQGHTVMEAINRQLAHYPYHIGQIVFAAKMHTAQWTSLSIPKGKSKDYNDEKFKEDKHRSHFTDEFLRNETDQKNKG